MEGMTATATRSDSAIASATAANSGTGAPASVDTSHGKTWRHRRISPQAGRALEILGHAIDYLIDEHVHNANARTRPISQIEEVQLLMKMRCQIYFECPEVPTVADRWRSLLRSRAA
jgi:hypothetical protein